MRLRPFMVDDDGRELPVGFVVAGPAEIAEARVLGLVAQRKRLQAGIDFSGFQQGPARRRRTDGRHRVVAGAQARGPGDLGNHMRRSLMLGNHAEIRAPQISERLDPGLGDDEMRQLAGIARDDAQRVRRVGKGGLGTQEIDSQRARPEPLGNLVLGRGAVGDIDIFRLEKPLPVGNPERQKENRSRVNRKFEGFGAGRPCAHQSTAGNRCKQGQRRHEPPRLQRKPQFFHLPVLR